MKAKIINKETNEVLVAFGTKYPDDFKEMEVEKAYNGNWYVKGYAPVKPAETYIEKRLKEYPTIGDQLDMIYWDKVNGTNIWEETITKIKEKYPKK